MAFTYDLAGTGDTLLISRVRMHIGDNVENSGVLPDGSNLQDAEILLFLSETSNDVDQTVGAISAMLARRWAVVADVRVGPRSESLSQVSKAWMEQAQSLNPTYQSFAIYGGRSDGYSDHADDVTEYSIEDED